jgi:hypothetical protein
MNFPILGAEIHGMSAVACGSATLPAARMATAQSSIGAANAVGATQNPAAALHLQYAREEYAQAEVLSRDGDGERAEVVLLRAESDAQLATEITRRDLARTAALSARAASNTPAPPVTP